MTLDRDLIRKIRSLDEYDLRRLVIFARGLLVQGGHDTDEAEAHGRAGKVTYRLEGVRCGKAGCAKCPHGPYWYAYWREEGKVRSRYIGRKLPAGAGKKQ